MQLNNLISTADTLGQLVQHFANLPTEREGATQAVFPLAAAQLIVAELAVHISKGTEPGQAMEATARGELSMPESVASVSRLMAVKPKT